VLCGLIMITYGAQVSIYDIQYTEVAGDGTYPSPLADQIVTTGGIVSAIDYADGRYFISNPEGGAWNGIFVYDNDYNPALGDSILITGLVYEYYGFSEIKNLNAFEIRNSGNELPPPALVSSSDIASLEAYESVLVQVNSVEIVSGFDTQNEWRIDDSSGPCIVSNGIYNFAELNVDLPATYPLASVTGVISFSHAEFRLHPRSLEDIKSENTGGIVSVGSASVYGVKDIMIPVNMMLFGGETAITSFSFSLDYDERIVAYNSSIKSGTLSNDGQIIVESVPGSITINYSGTTTLNNVGTLIKIQFQALFDGSSMLNIHSVLVNGSPVTYTASGEVKIFAESMPIGDTLTVIQRPLLNIPAILTPGDTLEVVAVANGSTGGWSAELQHAEHTLALEKISSVYDTALDRWLLEFKIPEPQFYELYDLHLTGSDLDDVTKNSVSLIPHYKEDYSFIHITDTHLAGHLFYQDEGSATDTSELIDLREVIKDINIINPEFVLLTGDLINEGELEDFENRRDFTKAVRLLKELEVPVYIVPGNHDLGGWTATPPPDGTARKNWWRFFGWPWLESPPVAEGLYTQDYSFDYGSTHYIGMESYINYDGWRSNIYGNDSFIPSQLAWLNADLAKAADSQSKVIFYHFDFSNNIDLTALDIDMALWGHTHRSSGDIYSHPYDLSTGSTSDENSRYRLIRVDQSGPQAEEAVYANWPSENLTLTYSHANDGSADSLSATIRNYHSLYFPKAQIKFVMPSGDHGYEVSGGTLEQVVNSDQIDICYVSVDIPGNASTKLTIAIDSGVGVNSAGLPGEWALHESYPNPFNPSTAIEFEIPEDAQVQLNIYSIDGALIKTLSEGRKSAGRYLVHWDGTDHSGTRVGSGVYLYRIESPSFSKTRKFTLLK